MKKATTIAKAFLKLSEPEVGDTISNLKLQKLLYYVQGFHLAIYNTPIFREDIWAWEHGPVVREVYKEYKRYSDKPIPVPESGVTLTKKESDLITNVWKVYGQFSAWKLRDLTHGEKPWIETAQNSVISQDTMKLFFKSRIAG